MNNMIKKSVPVSSAVNKVNIFGAALFFLSTSIAQAFSFTVNITGTVIDPPPCIINNNNPINISFGNDLLTTKIDGSNYTKNVDFSLVCTGNPTTMRLQFQGTGSTFDNAMLKTNNNDLGIKLLKPDGSQLNLNSWYNFTYSSSAPAIKAVPVKKTSAILEGGAFSGTATLLVEIV